MGRGFIVFVAIVPCSTPLGVAPEMLSRGTSTGSHGTSKPFAGHRAQSSLWGTKLAKRFSSTAKDEADDGHELRHRTGLTVTVVHVTDVPGRGELTALTKLRTGRKGGTSHYWKNDIAFICCHSLYRKVPLLHTPAKYVKVLVQMHSLTFSPKQVSWSI